MDANKIKLVALKHIDMYHFEMWEGKFQDLEQNAEIYFYANLSNFDTPTFEESEVRAYAHSYDDLYDPDGYELNLAPSVEQRVKEIILDALKAMGNN